MCSIATEIFLSGLMAAIAGTVFIRISESENEVLGFIPQWVEHKFTPESAAYKMVTCSKCMAGQFAFWVGFAWVLKNIIECIVLGDDRNIPCIIFHFVCTIFAAIYINFITEYVVRITMRDAR